MAGNVPLEKRLRFAGVCLILGLAVEAACLLWTRPLAFVLFAGVGGGLIAVGVLYFLYSLVADHKVENKNA